MLNTSIPLDQLPAPIELCDQRLALFDEWSAAMSD